MNNHPKTILTQVNGWTPILDSILAAHGPTVALVFGRVWRYCQMRDGLCSASIQTIADDLHFNRNTVRKAIHVLIENRYLEDLDPEEKGFVHRYQDTGRAALVGRFDAVLNEIDEPRVKSAGLEDSPRVKSATPPRKLRGGPRVKSATKRLFQDRIQDTKGIWNDILSTLRGEMPKAAYDNYLRGTQIIAVEGETWRIRCAPDTGNWLTSRMAEIIRRALEGYTGEAVKVQFVEG